LRIHWQTPEKGKEPGKPLFVGARLAGEGVLKIAFAGKSDRRPLAPTGNEAASEQTKLLGGGFSV
jgi:hypothetical protein